MTSPSIPEAPKILDVTVRDGSYLINHQFSPSAVSEIAKQLESAGIEFAEISHGCGIGSKMMGMPGLADDDVLLEAAKKAAPNLKLSAFISANDYSLPLIPALVEFLELGRVGVNVDQVSSAQKVIQKLKKYNKTVSLQLVRSHALPPEKVAQAAKNASNMGVDIIYVVDSFGSMMPADVKKYVSALKSEVKNPIGFHAHNHIGLAIPNTLTAWDHGATWLDASLMGVGRGAGNAILEILIQQLQEKGLATGVQLDILCQATEKAVLPIFFYPPWSRWIDLCFSDCKIDFSPDSVLDLLTMAIHLPLNEFCERLRGKMGDAVQLADPHLKAVVEEAGFNFEQILSSLKDAPK